MSPPNTSILRSSHPRSPNLSDGFLGVSKYLRAREYRKANQAALLYAAKEQADLSSYTQGPGSSSAPDVDRDQVVGVAVSLCRIYLWCKDAFPTFSQKDDWAVDVWREACEKTGANRASFIQPELFTDSSMRLFLETKKKISDAVELYYDFDASRSSKSRNADLASSLLRDMTFVYRNNNPDRALHHPYQHPVIQKVISTTWFRNSTGDGFVFKEHFFPLPVPAIAFIVTVIECCIDEWSDGSHKETSWEEDRFKTVYQSHLDAIDKFRLRSDDVFEQFRSGLSQEAKHAVPSFTYHRRKPEYTQEPGGFWSWLFGKTTIDHPVNYPRLVMYPCRWPGCQVPVRGDQLGRLGGFCCDTQMWDAVYNGTAEQCPRCQRVCPQGHDFCSDACANGR